jgi:streptogramin lyase/predicted Ser/Thr protein kinase
LSSPLDPRIGSELFGYRVESLLGRGGMGVVYLAHDLALERKVALKLLATEWAEDERFRARFLRESRLAASLDHPNVIPIYEAGETDGLLCIAMRYVDGTDLKRLLRLEGALDAEQAIGYCAQVAAALDAAHARNLVHRDVKPSNVLVADGGHCYLADFGLSQAADHRDGQTGQFLGSVDYAAPEQIEGKPLDGRADVYSLGCLLYECLAGSVPFPKDSDLAVLWAHLQEPPPGLASFPALDPVVKRALAKQPADRYQTCNDLVVAARAALPRTGPSRRRRLLLAGLAALVLAVGLTAGLELALGGGGHRPRDDLTVRDNTLVRIDPQTNRIAAVTRAGAPGLLTGAFDVAAGGETVWVYNWGDRTVRAIDARSNALERLIAIGGIAPATGNAIAADAHGAWVLSRSGGSGVLTRVQLGLAVPESFALRYYPLALAVGDGAVWVAATRPDKQALLKIDPITGRTLATVDLRGPDIRSVAVGDGAVWALRNSTIFRIDPAAARITGTVDLGAVDSGQVAAGHGAVWATIRTAEGSNVLAHVDPRTLRVIRRIPEPTTQSSSTPTRVALGDGAVWWNGADTGAVWRVDPKTDKVVSRMRITPALTSFDQIEPLGITTTPDGVWVTVSFGP